MLGTDKCFEYFKSRVGLIHDVELSVLRVGKPLTWAQKVIQDTWEILQLQRAGPAGMEAVVGDTGSVGAEEAAPHLMC